MCLGKMSGVSQLRNVVKFANLLELGELKLEFIGPILRILQHLLQFLYSVIILDAFLKFLRFALIPI